MERRSRSRIRHGELTSFQVVLADELRLEGRLVDISEAGFQFAVECQGPEMSKPGESGPCYCTLTQRRHSVGGSRPIVMPGFLTGPRLEDDFSFHGHILWTWHDQERDRLYAGFRFLAPKELPDPFLRLAMGEE